MAFTEQELAEGCRKNNRKYQQALYECYAGKLFALCLRYANDRMQAEDFLQEGFIRIFSKIDQFKGDGSLEGWMKRVMVNTALQHLRREKSTPYFDDIEEANPVLANEENALDKMAAEEITYLINLLPNGYKLIFNMFVVEEYSHKEIANELGITEGTSKSQLARARNYLQKLIKKMKVYNINKQSGAEDNNVREKLNAHSVNPPSYIWDNVEQNLPQKGNKRPFIFWLMPLAACIAGLAGLLYVLLPKNGSQSHHGNAEKSFVLAEEKNVDNTLISSAEKNATFNNKNEIEGKKTGLNKLEISENKNVKKDFLRSAKSKNRKSNAIFYKNQQDNNLTVNFTEGQSKTLKNELIVKQENVISTDIPGIKNTEADFINKPLDSTLAPNKLENFPKSVPKISAKNQVKNSQKDKWAIGVYGGLGYAYRFLNNSSGLFNIQKEDMAPTSSPGGVTEYTLNYNKVESAGKSCQAGLNLRYKINKNWNFSSGINYSQNTIKSHVNAVIHVNRNVITNANTDTTIIQKNSTGEFTFSEQEEMMVLDIEPQIVREETYKSENYNIKYTFGFLDIPLHLQYKTSAKKTAWFINGGASVRFLVNKKATYAPNEKNNSIQLLQPYNLLALSADISSGVSVPFRNFDLEIGPGFSYFLSPLMKTQPKTHLYAAQLQSAIYYNF